MSPDTPSSQRQDYRDEDDVVSGEEDYLARHPHPPPLSPTSTTAMLRGSDGSHEQASGLRTSNDEFVHATRDKYGREHLQSHSDDAQRSFTDELFSPVADWARGMRWTRNKPPTDRRRRWLLIVSYAPDWIITILLALLLALTDKAHGFRREFSLTDTSLQHTHALEQRVPVWLLVVIALIGPILIQGFFSLVIARSVWDFHASLLGLVVSHAISVTMTNILKVTVGRPRPDIIDRCQPRAGSMNAPIYGLVTDAICTNDVNTHLVSDGFRSFPSGHSSTAFAGLVFLSMYLAGKMHLFSTRSKGHAAVSWIVWFPIAAATMIAVSRTMDYRHHATDVIAGGILGTLTAFGVYYLYYPSLRSVWCHKPLAPRIERRRAGSGEADLEGGGMGASRSGQHAAAAAAAAANAPALEMDAGNHSGFGRSERGVASNV